MTQACPELFHPLGGKLQRLGPASGLSLYFSVSDPVRGVRCGPSLLSPFWLSVQASTQTLFQRVSQTPLAR